MTKEELFILNMIDENNKSVLRGENLYDQTDRTLLYGYDGNGDSVHVYLKNKEIIVVWYDMDKIIKRYIGDEVESNDIYIPNKRIYYSLSDFEFCSELKKLGYSMSFTESNKKYDPDKTYQIDVL